jgi:hypothetical protein
VLVVDKITPQELEENPVGNNAALAFCDIYGHCMAGILVEILKVFRSVDAKDIENTVSKLRVGRVFVAPAIVNSAKARDRLQYLTSRIAAERAIEGSLVSPDWYVGHLLAIGIHDGLANAVETVVSEFAEAFVDLPKKLAAAGRHTIAAQIIQRGLECSKRVAILLEAAKECEKVLSQFYRIPDLQSDRIDWSMLESRRRAHVAGYRAFLGVISDRIR